MFVSAASTFFLFIESICYFLNLSKNLSAIARVTFLPSGAEIIIQLTLRVGIYFLGYFSPEAYKYFILPSISYECGNFYFHVFLSGSESGITVDANFYYTGSFKVGGLPFNNSMYIYCCSEHSSTMC